jgi:hypothetical protein
MPVAYQLSSVFPVVALLVSWKTTDPTGGIRIAIFRISPQKRASRKKRAFRPLRTKSSLGEYLGLDSNQQAYPATCQRES